MELREDTGQGKARYEPQSALLWKTDTDTHTQNTRTHTGELAHFLSPWGQVQSTGTYMLSASLAFVRMTDL